MVVVVEKLLSGSKAAAAAKADLGMKQNGAATANAKSLRVAGRKRGKRLKL